MVKVIVATYQFKGSFERSLKMEIKVCGKFDYENRKIIIDNEALEEASLVIFTGGEDINPNIYGEENKYSSYSDRRDEIELKVFKKAFIMGKKILGVCRGHQLINACLGGKLVQDINRQLGQSHESYHNLNILEKSSKIANLFPKDVNSMHHQGVISSGNGLVPTTFYNGVYESCESEQIITTQFHPEFMDYNSKDFFNFIKSWANLI